MDLSWLNDKYIDNFEFIKGKTWLSTWYVPLIAVPVYLGVLELTRKWIAQRLKDGKKAFELKQVVIVHNSLLSIASGVLFVALATELLVQMLRTSFVHVFCDPDPAFQFASGRLYFYYYLNYLFKFVELIDTELLVLRNRPTPFLHTYHHAATMVLCWSQLRAQSCVQWVPIVINLFVHVVMYMYYALHACGIDVWWKKYLTMLQIVQFVVALVGCFGGLLPRAFNDLGISWWPRCHGEYGGAFFGIGILATYLILFVNLYQASYKGGKPKTASQRAKESSAVVANQTNGSHKQGSKKAE